MPSATETAARLRAARGYAGLTQRQLAKLMGISVETLSRIENARRTASAEEIERIVALCEGVPMEFIKTGFELIVEHGAAPAQGEVIARLRRVEGVVAQHTAVEQRVATLEDGFRELLDLLVAANAQTAARGAPMIEGELLRRLLAVRPIDESPPLPESRPEPGAQPNSGE